MPIDYSALAKRIQAPPADGQVTSDTSAEPNDMASLIEKYAGTTVSEVGQPLTPMMTGAPAKPGGFFTGIARAVAPLGDAIGSALATGGAKKMEADTTARSQQLASVAIALIKNPNLNPEQKQRALKAMQISKDVGVISPSGAFEATGKQVLGQALGTFGSVVAGGGAAMAGRLGLKGAAGIAATALGEGAVSGATIGAGAGLAKGDGSTWSEALKTGAIAAAFPVLGAALGGALPKMANALERINLRLTPTQKVNLGGKLDEVTNYIRSKNIIGSPETRFEKMTSIYNKMERDFQDAISGGKFLESTGGRTVPRQKVIDELEAIKNEFVDHRDYRAIVKQVDELTARMHDFPEAIPVDRLNKLKRSTFKEAFNRAGDKVNDAIEFRAGDIFKTNVEESLKGLTINGLPADAFNKEYGTVINARKLLKIASGRNEIGVVGRIISTMVGGSVGAATGGLGGGALGTAVGQNVGGLIAGTPVRSALSNFLTQAEKGTGRVGTVLKSPTGSRVVDQLKASALQALAQR
jgi:hypothetical protein